MENLNKIITKSDKIGKDFIKWYMEFYNKHISINNFLAIEDDYKVFVVLTYAEEVYGINILCDNFSFIVCYSMRYYNRKDVIEYVRKYNTNVIYQHTDDKFESLLFRYKLAIQYVFTAIIK